jgi:uncharacterized protein (TIGR03492 family)
MKLLCLSNGHGEDGIGVKIALRLQQRQSAQHPQPPLQLAALPIVGLGAAYTHVGIPLLMPGQVMPSGGFLNMDSNELWRDLRQGLLPQSWQQLRQCQNWAAAGGNILAVGDIVPLLFAWLSGGDYAFVGTAKSDYYLQGSRQGGSDYFPWEQWLMRHRRCRAIFPRDTPTAQTLRTRGMRAFDLGNPMMDDLREEEVGLGLAPRPLGMLLLPGSRPPEAYGNWQLLLQAVASVLKCLPDAPGLLAQHQRQVVFFAAIDPRLTLWELMPDLAEMGWVVADSPFLPERFERLPNAQAWQLQYPFAGVQIQLWLAPAGFSLCAQWADVAIAMAGTATEQFVGLGKPVVTLPGQGPQFTRLFAQRQARLLGPSLTLMDQPEEVGAAVCEILQDPQRLEMMRVNGQTRMGPSGAAERIADHLLGLGW